jgi:hypothetical protein
MEHDEQARDEREAAKSHQASVEIADALAKMFAELKPKIMAKHSLQDEQIILLAIAKTAVKLGQILCRLAHSRRTKQRSWSENCKV